MKYVGIANSDFKRIATKLAPKKGKKVEVNLPCVTSSDCNRHFEILRLLDNGAKKISDFKDTEYYRFNRSNGKSDETIMDKIEKFRSLYESIKKNGYDYSKGYIILSEDGARLDGSHRSTIIEHLGFKSITVLIVKWKSIFGDKDLSDLHKHIKSQQKKYNGD